MHSDGTYVGRSAPEIGEQCRCDSIFRTLIFNAVDVFEAQVRAFVIKV